LRGWKGGVEGFAINGFVADFYVPCFVRVWMGLALSAVQIGRYIARPIFEEEENGC
jgi:hypothetical protein